MRYAVLSDIHSNLEALTAVLEALANERIDRYLCLGDVIGYGADPHACLERLRACNALVVGGNHDLACIGKLDVAWFNDAARAAILWTRDQLSIVDVDGIRRFPLTAIEGPFTLVHGTLRHPQRFEYLIEAGQAMETLACCRTLLCLVGHTHLSCVLEYDRDQRRLTRILTEPAQLADVPLTNRPDTVRYLLNPRSVGQPRDGDPRASMAVVDTDAARISIRRIPYDIAAAQAKIRAAGLPEFLADRLGQGR